MTGDATITQNAPETPLPSSEISQESGSNDLKTTEIPNKIPANPRKLKALQLVHKILRREDQCIQLLMLRLLLKFEPLAMHRRRMEAQLNADESCATALS